MLRTLRLSTRSATEMLDISEDVQELVTESGIAEGLVYLFVPHTTAAVTINENADPDVAKDLISGLTRVSPPRDDYRHREGNSDAHLKSSLIGAGEQVLISGGRLLLGTWQGIYFCEFDGPRRRQLHLKIIPG